MKQYETFKPIKSIVFKEAPITWNKYRVKDTVDKNTYYPVGDGDHGSIKPEMYKEEGVPYIRVQNLTWHGEILTDGIVCISDEVQLANKKSILYPDDILIAKTGATIGKLGLIPEQIKEANTTSSVGKLTVDKTKFNPKYILYCFQSNALQDQIWLEASQKSAQPGFNIDDLIVFEFLAPDLKGQSKIVEFLDHQTAIIDQLIKQKEKLIRLLKEKRQAVINEAVTKGLNPKVKMKDSGIEWLGEVPESWELRNMEIVARKDRYSITGGPFGSDLKNEEYTEDGVRIIQLQNIGVGEFRDDYKIFTTEEKADYLFSSNIFPGEIIIAKMADPVARACIVPDIADRFIMASDGIRLEVDTEKFNTKFIEYSLNAKYFNYQAELNSTGTTRLRIGLTTLKKLKLLLPNLAEQNQIVEYLESYNLSFIETIGKLSSQIEKLKEYRQSLISETVTGKIDVRDWKPNN
jgi:type I restriction enzyme S subunit